MNIKVEDNTSNKLLFCNFDQLCQFCFILLKNILIFYVNIKKGKTNYIIFRKTIFVNIRKQIILFSEQIRFCLMF